ncbi:MAG: heat shock protein Hsp20, family protein [Candidatus Doudnabacteria bacterium]|nr:heat shock protein Hsp20, family protein [Candidatus Doudnabacteria bacterium]
MAKEKKSFFGKIMGGDEPAQPVSINNMNTEQYVQPLQAVEEITEEQILVEPEEDNEVQEMETDMEPKSETEEEWMSDYEGTLNIDLYQTKDNVIIKSTIAGVKPEDLDITIANDMVTIKGERVKAEKIAAEDYFYQECYWGGFSRSVILPVDIDSEHVEADLKDGILTVILPKAAKAKTKKIKVSG